MLKKKKNKMKKEFAKVTKEILYNANNPVNGTILPILVTVIDDENHFLKWTINGGFIFYQVVNLTAILIGFLIGVRGQILVIKEHGFNPTTAQICLLFNNMALVTNFLYVLDL